jgi:hypothetical protein
LAPIPLAFYRRPELAYAPLSTILILQDVRSLLTLRVHVKRLYYGVYSLRPPRATKMNDEVQLTITVPQAGKKYFNLSRDASYAAAQRGDIPTIRIGRLLRVPVAAMDRKLESAGRS